jgi:hypothetical protein
MKLSEAKEFLPLGRRITRGVWGGYWFNIIVAGSVITLAHLKDGGIDAAMPYPADWKADDWIVLPDHIETEAEANSRPYDKIFGEISDRYHTFNQLYEHRITIYLAMCRLVAAQGKKTVWMSKTHSDGSVWDGWFLLGIGEQNGEQITYHLPDSYWEPLREEALFVLLEKAPPFDGHSSEDVLIRLNAIR